MGEVNRRAFLERMTALSATAMVAPRMLTARPLGAGPSRSGLAAPPPGAAMEAVATDFDLAAVPMRPIADVRQVANVTELTLTEAAHLIRVGDIGAVELVEAYLARIERWEPDYKAFNTLLAEEALAAARTADQTRRRAPLAGVPLAIKDNFFTAGVRTTANSFLFEDFVPDFDATAWARLRDAGAILLGKTQMGPLATTSATTPTGDRTTVNAWAPFAEDVSPGGSSSGSATATAARLAACGTGTQTGGSITSPSNAQGLTGIKPTMGRVSLQGILPLTYTRDHVGPLARDAIDAAVMLQVMAGPDPADPRSLGLPPVPDYVEAVRPVDRRGRPTFARPVRIGVLPDFLDEPEPPPEGEPDPADDVDRVGGAFPRPDRSEAAYQRRLATIRARRDMLRTLESLGADVVEIAFPAQWSTLTSSAFNNVRLPERSEIFLEHLRDDVRKFGVSLSPWINGLLLPGVEYVRGSRARLVLLRRILSDVFSRCDLVTQTVPFPFDMVGLPLIAFPIGFEGDSTGAPRPIGGLFGAEPYAEDHLLAVIAAYQRVSDGHRQRPADPDQLRPSKGGPRGRARRLDLFDVMELGQ